MSYNDYAEDIKKGGEKVRKLVDGALYEFEGKVYQVVDGDEVISVQCGEEDKSKEVITMEDFQKQKIQKWLREVHEKAARLPPESKYKSKYY